MSFIYNTNDSTDKEQLLSFAKQVVFKQWLIFLVGSSGSNNMRGGLVLSFTLLNDRRNRKSNYSMPEEHVGSREYVTPHLCRNQD